MLNKILCVVWQTVGLNFSQGIVFLLWIYQWYRHAESQYAGNVAHFGWLGDWRMHFVPATRKVPLQKWQDTVFAFTFYSNWLDTANTLMAPKVWLQLAVERRLNQEWRKPELLLRTRDTHVAAVTPGFLLRLQNLFSSLRMLGECLRWIIDVFGLFLEFGENTKWTMTMCVILFWMQTVLIW